MNVLSLFDGMSGGQLALQKAGLRVDKYYSCEIDEYAQSVTRYNFPGTIFLGDVTKVDFSKLENIDLVCFGSPCQDVSFSGKGAGLEGSRSRLFYKAVEAIKICNPEYFFMENVKMKQEYQDIISDLLGVQPIFINSADFSAQNRQRLYWTNIDILPYDTKQVNINDIIEDQNNSVIGSAVRGRYLDGKVVQHLELRKDDKLNAITTVRKDYLLAYKDIKETNVSDHFYYSPKMLAWIDRHGKRKHTKLKIQYDNDKVQMI